ncbi:hypothetical protein EGS38_03285 [Neisseria chenwenguii]|nr:hypothetical protein EGS38_03285 [Neisseria chenwenguii]
MRCSFLDSDGCGLLFLKTGYFARTLQKSLILISPLVFNFNRLFEKRVYPKTMGMRVVFGKKGARFVGGRRHGNNVGRD